MLSIERRKNLSIIIKYPLPYKKKKKIPFSKMQTTPAPNIITK